MPAPASASDLDGADTLDWGPNLSPDGHMYVRRYQVRDCWEIYIPVSGWTLEEASDVRTKWTSDSGSGSTLVVRRASAEELTAERPALAKGQAERFLPTGDGDYWLVFTQYDPKILIDSSWVGKEPEVLQKMAESFGLFAAAGPDSAEDYVAVSGGNSVAMTRLAAGETAAEAAKRVAWLPIVYDDYGQPFEILHAGQRRICAYAIIDAETLEPLDFFRPSGLMPQTYVFQNAQPGRRYIVTAYTFFDEGSFVFGALLMSERGSGVSADALRTLKREDPARFTALMEGWNAEVNMLGEQFVSEAGEAGDWWDVLNAFAGRWCRKYLQTSEDSPFCCSDGIIWRIGDYLYAVSLSSSPRRLAFNVTLALGLPAEREEAFAYARMGWAAKNEHGMYEISTEVVMRSDDGIHWTVEALNSGGSGGWGWRNLRDDDTMDNIRYAIEIGSDIILLRFLPNMDWNELSSEETAAVMRMLQEAAVSDEPGYADRKDQLFRDLYMLWGLKRADGAYAELYLDGPDSILARQHQADPAAFDAALAEMDEATQTLVRLDKQTW